MTKIKTEDLIKKILKSEKISEAEMKLLNRRLNAGEKMSEMKYQIDAEIECAKSYANKGLKWLNNLRRTPKGAERKKNPFGSREEEVLDNEPRVYFAGFMNAGGWFNSWYAPVYQVCGGGYCFDYYVKGGKIEIIA